MRIIPKTWYYVLPDEEAFITLSLISRRLTLKAIEHIHGIDQLTRQEQICFKSAQMRDKAIEAIREMRAEADIKATIANFRKDLFR